MAITFSLQRKKHKYLILVLILAVLVILIVLLRGFLLKPKIEKPEEIITKKPPLIEIDFEILESPILKELQPFEEISPLEEGKEFGRENPFVPY